MRQLVPVIFERISGQAAEERQLREEPSPQFAQLVASILPKDTDPFVVDAYLMFQDIVVSKDTTGLSKKRRLDCVNLQKNDG